MALFFHECNYEFILLTIFIKNFVWLFRMQEFVDDGHGKLAGIKAVQVEWKKDFSGRWIMNELPDTEKVPQNFY